MVLFKKKEKDWTLEEQYNKRDCVIIAMAENNESYAENLPDDTYERLSKYVQEDMIKLDGFKKGTFSKRLKKAVENLKEDKQEQKEDEVTPEQVSKEENGEIIDMVEKINEQEKQEQKEVDKKPDKKNRSDVREKQKTKDDDMNNILKEYLSSEKCLDNMARGIGEKYLNVFDKSRDDILDLCKTLCNDSNFSKDILNEYSNYISNCIKALENTTEDHIIKYGKSNKKSKERAEEIITVMNIAKNKDTENRINLLLDSIFVIFVSYSISLRISQLVDDIKSKNDDTTISTIKTKIIELKNEIENVPDAAREKLMVFINDIETFTKYINDTKDSTKQTSYNTESTFIPKDKKEPVNFGKKWKKDAINFDYDKMLINLNSSPNTNTTKKNAKEIKMILELLSDIVSKEMYQYSLDSLINGTFELKLIRNSDGEIFTYIIDTGAVLGHGNYIYADNHYISMKEKDILTKLFNDPEKFKLDDNELKVVQSYLFKNPRLYEYVDMKGSKADKIKYLSDEDYIKLGDMLTDILNSVVYEKFKNTYRFRFKSFNSIDDFILVSDRYVNNVLNSTAGITPVETTLIYKDNKAVLNYGGEQSSQVISFNS